MELLKRICFSIFLFPIVFLAAGILLIYTGYSDYQDYKIAYDVTAIVTKCKYDFDYGTDDMPDSGYDIYISYTFDGNEYSDIYWQTKNNSVNIGETVSVKVSPNIPEKPFSGNPLGLLIGGVLFALFGIILSFKLIPASFSGKEEVITGLKLSPKSKKVPWFAFVPVVPAMVFLILGLNISPLFHIGTITFAYFTVVLLEIISP